MITAAHTYTFSSISCSANYQLRIQVLRSSDQLIASRIICLHQNCILLPPFMLNQNRQKTLKMDFQNTVSNWVPLSSERSRKDKWQFCNTEIGRFDVTCLLILERANDFATHFQNKNNYSFTCLRTLKSITCIILRFICGRTMICWDNIRKHCNAPVSVRVGTTHIPSTFSLSSFNV